MAQSRLLSVVVKQEKLQNDILEIEKTIGRILKTTATMRKQKFGRKGKADAARNAVRPEDIVTMRQTSHSIDHLLLKVQHLLNRATAHNFFIQRQLELRSHQD